MRIQRQSFLPIFFLFLFLSLIFFLILRNSKLGFLEIPLFSIQSVIFKVAQIPGGWLVNKKIELLKKENLDLKSRLVDYQKLQRDNTALRDQFETTGISTNILLPANIIGDPNFFPGVNKPEALVIDKGEKDGIIAGDVVIYKNNLIGIVGSESSYGSLVILSTNKSSSFTGVTSDSAQGLITGQGNGGMVIGNVLLSDVLKVGSLIVTSGSQNIAGKGIPPGLIAGKIISVNKNPSSLYQSASVESLVNVEKLTTVFVMKGGSL